MLNYLRLTLRADEILIADLAHPAQLHCEQGSVWLASNQHPQDLVLKAGEQHTLSPGHLLLEGTAELRFTAETLTLRPYFKSQYRGAA